MVDHSHLWQSDKQADYWVRLVARETQSVKFAPKQAAQGAIEPQEETTSATMDAYDLPVHDVVLTKEWREHVSSSSEGNSSSSSSEGGVASQLVVVCSFEDIEQVQAARAALQYAYCGRLPTGASVPLLHDMAVIAKAWRKLDVVAACLTAAVDAINCLLADGTPQDAQLPSQAAVQDCSKYLMAMSGMLSTQQILMMPKALQAFCQLKLHAVKMWAEQDELQVDSENTVAALFSHWWASNSSSFSKCQLLEATGILTSSLRVGNITRSYLDLLPQLPWYKPDRTAKSLLGSVHGKQMHTLPKVLQEQLPYCWTKPPHAAAADQVVSLDCILTLSELEELHSIEGAGHKLSPKTLPLHGYECQVGVGFDKTHAGLYCLVRLLPALPKALVEATGVVVMPTTLDVVVRTACRDKAVTPSACMEEWPALQYDYCTLYAAPLCAPGCAASSSCFLPHDMWVDGKLHLKVTLGAFL